MALVSPRQVRAPPRSAGRIPRLQSAPPGALHPLSLLLRSAGNHATGAVLQRACACGGGAGTDDPCHCPTKEHEQSAGGVSVQRKLAISAPGDAYEVEADRVADAVMRMPIAGAPRLQRLSTTPTGSGVAPPIVHDVIRAPGEPLDPAARAYLEPRFGRDLSAVRVHRDATAAESARAVDARAYTVGHHVVFESGQYHPETQRGRRLLAHELTHVVQQGAVGDACVQRDPDEHAAPAGPKATDFRRITMRFDGSDLTVLGDGTEVFRFSAQSGRPLLITTEHARECGANAVTDTYMNDKRFVGIKDFGPIPEGTYTFAASAIQRFTAAEERRLIIGGILGEHSVTAAGTPMHPGDWGSGRVALTPVGRLRPGPCGNPSARSGFFLHGGILAGSSGCIDIGGDFDRVADFLSGFRGSVTVTVEYTNTPPSIRYFTGLSGAVAYGGFDFQHGPRLAIGAEFGGRSPHLLASVGYDAVAAWAGGALSAGLHLDVPLDDPSAFVRAGLTVGTNFRILGALYGRLFGGGTLPLTGEPSRVDLSLGGGLGYDFGPVQLEALYNVLRPMSDDERVHNVLLGVGFRFGRE